MTFALICASVGALFLSAWYANEVDRLRQRVDALHAMLRAERTIYIDHARRIEALARQFNEHTHHIDNTPQLPPGLLHDPTRRQRAGRG